MHSGRSPQVAVNIRAIDRFLASEYKVEDDRIISKGKVSDSFDYVTCMTAVFDSPAGKAALQSASAELRDRLIRIYDAFRRIKNKAEARKAVFRPWRAQHYLDVVNEFAGELHEAAVQLANET